MAEEPTGDIIAGKRAKASDFTDKLETRLQDLILYVYGAAVVLQQPSLFSGRKKLEDCCTIPCQKLPRPRMRENIEDGTSPHSCCRSGKEDTDSTGSEDDFPCEHPNSDNFLNQMTAYV